jgi:hypothetical protein
VPHTGLPVERRLSWCVEVLPYVEQADLHARFDRRAAWDADASAAAAQTALEVFRCPDWVREEQPAQGNLTAYVGVAGLGADAATLPAGHRRAGVFGYDRRTALADVKDGRSQTLLLLESARDNGPWAQGGPATVRALDPEERPHLGRGRPLGGTHFGENTLFWRAGWVGCNAAMADGSVRYFADNVSPRLLEALATASGGDEVGNDW